MVASRQRDPARRVPWRPPSSQSGARMPTKAGSDIVRPLHRRPPRRHPRIGLTSKSNEERPCAPVAQLDRASGFEPEGRGFESLPACHSNSTIECLKRPVLDWADGGSTQERSDASNPSRRASLFKWLGDLRVATLRCPTWRSLASQPLDSPVASVACTARTNRFLAGERRRDSAIRIAHYELAHRASMEDQRPRSRFITSMPACRIVSLFAA